MHEPPAKTKAVFSLAVVGTMLVAACGESDTLDDTLPELPQPAADTDTDTRRPLPLDAGPDSVSSDFLTSDIAADCGNGVIDGLEWCDGEAGTIDNDCSAWGLGSGTIGCHDDCSFDFSACATLNLESVSIGFVTSVNAGDCGNGVIDGVERCDGEAYTYDTSCSAWGLGYGTIACNVDCSLDFSGCTASDFCAAQEPSWYDDGFCDPCELWGGTKDPDCSAYCGVSDGFCADYFQDWAGIWTCDFETGQSDPDCSCGNGIADAWEWCDGTDTHGWDCSSFGFTSGQLGCGNCAIAFTACSSVPTSWTCDYAYYADGYCDCGCSVRDPDCNNDGCSGAGCSANACEYCFDANGREISCAPVGGENHMGDNVTLYLNLGDSVGAGFNASGQNSSGGQGYARLMWENHWNYPNYSNANVRARFPLARFVNRAKSGGTSGDVLKQSNNLPSANGGDVVVTIYVGGNDFNDKMVTMLLAPLTQLAIFKWTQNMTTVVSRLRAAYDRPNSGQTLTITVATIHEPTDGTMSIPPQYDHGFCKPLQKLLSYPAFVKELMFANYRRFNVAIRSFANEQGARLIDSEYYFQGHGLNASGTDRWMASDCAHLTNEGHHQLRREVWYKLTGDRF